MSSKSIRRVSTAADGTTSSACEGFYLWQDSGELTRRSIKKQRAHKNCVFPDRSDVTMTVPFMDAYVRLLIQTCHKWVQRDSSPRFAHFRLTSLA
jgi:hypothetical protein